MKLIKIDKIEDAINSLHVYKFNGQFLVPVNEVLNLLDNEQAIELNIIKTDILDIASAMSRPIVEVLDLSVRAQNCLARYEIKTIADLYEILVDGRLMRIRNIGTKTAYEIEDVLNKYLSGFMPNIILEGETNDQS